MVLQGQGVFPGIAHDTSGWVNDGYAHGDGGSQYLTRGSVRAWSPRRPNARGHQRRFFSRARQDLRLVFQRNAGQPHPARLMLTTITSRAGVSSSIAGFSGIQGSSL